jgi:thiamine kinase-like enzyme
LGGLSNHVFKIVSDEKTEFIFKILISEADDPFKWHEKECLPYIYKVLPPPVFESPKYRIEACIPNIEPPMNHFLTPPASCLVTRSLAKFNSLHSIRGEKPNLFRILDADRDKIYGDIEANLPQASPEDRQLYRQQMARLESLLQVLENEYVFEELVVSHNDLFYRNIMIDISRNRYQIIEFEYVGYNPLGMDLYQFVNEWLNDYETEGEGASGGVKLVMENYPSDARIREMVRFFLFFYENWQKFEGRPDDEALVAEVRESEAFKAISDERVEQIAVLFPYFAILANTFWYYWGLSIFKTEGIDMDYAGFSKLKFLMIEIFVEKLGNKNAIAAFKMKADK